jgi:hypothetical protein
MIGLSGEAYPVEFEKFAETYRATGEPFNLDLLYPPTVLNKNTGVRVSLLEFAEACEGKGGSTVRAMRLESRVKVFTHWDPENYVHGDPGDWIVERSPGDIYVVTEELFEKLYIRDCSGEDISAEKDAFRVIKKDLSVPVTFAREAGVLKTLEGSVSYKKGDALLTGPYQDSWPVARKYFFETYSPVADIQPGLDGEYRKERCHIWALQIYEPFMVELSENRGILHGKHSDWLLQYDANEYGVIRQEFFDATYDILP